MRRGWRSSISRPWRPISRISSFSSPGRMCHDAPVVESAAVTLWRHLRRLPLLALPLLLLACAPKLQPLGPPIADPAFGGNQLMMNDGVALPLRHWPAEGKTKAVVLALHGFNDYSKSFEEPAEDWAKA